MQAHHVKYEAQIQKKKVTFTQEDFHFLKKEVEPTLQS